MGECSKIFVITNSFPEKKPLFSTNEFEYALKNYENIFITSFSKHKKSNIETGRIIFLSLFEGFKEIIFPKRVKKMSLHLINIKHIVSFNIKEMLKNIQSYFLALSIIRTTEINKNDLVFSYWLSRSSRIAFYLHNLIGTDYICQGHGSDIYIYPPDNIETILNNALKVITVGEKNKLYICKKYNISEDKVVVFRQGVANSFIELLMKDRKKIKNKDKKVFLTVGNYESVKGIDLLLEAIKGLVKESRLLDKIEFRIYGSGSKFNDYKKYIKENNLSGYVHLNGWINRENLAEELKNVDCYILPSRSEGLPNVLMEASAASLPIIATNVGSVSEIAINGENAILINDVDSDGIREAILEFLKFSDERLNLMARKSYEIFKMNYKLEENLKDKYDYIQKLNIRRITNSY
jgi:glycosyltransferase involved in cell wall biosynthesis